MYKLGTLKDGEWIAHDHPATFEMQPQRIVAGTARDGGAVFRALTGLLPPPCFLLYILHTPRGEAEPGRYQSPALERPELDTFLDRFGHFLSADSRHDVWMHSPTDNATIVWDRHNLIFAYGPLDRFATTLRDMGFTEGRPKIPAPHEHHYRAEFDTDAMALHAAMDWSMSPLQPEDEQ